MAACDCIYIGGGAAHFTPETAPGVHADNWTELAHTTFGTGGSVTEVPVPNYNSLVGGNCDKLERVDALTFSITVHNYCPQILAAQLGGTITNRTASAVSDEPHKAYKGKLLPVLMAPDMAQTLTLKDGGGTPLPTTEYTRTTAGLIPNDTFSLADGADVLVDYQNAVAVVINAFKSTGAVYAFRFPSTNLVGKKGLYSVLLRRGKVTITNGMGFKTTDAPSFTMSGELLADPNIPETDPLSQYMQIEIVEP